MMSEVFWTFFVSAMSGFCLKIASMLYKSKCKKCKFCGVECERDVEVEEDLDEFEMLHKPKDVGVEEEKNNKIV